MFEDENQIENQVESKVENQVERSHEEAEPVVVRRRITRRHRREEAPAQNSASAVPASPAVNPVPESTEGRSKLSINDLTQLGLAELRQKALDMGVPRENLGSLKKQDLICSLRCYKGCIRFCNRGRCDARRV